LGILICIGSVLFIEFIFYLRSEGKLIIDRTRLFIKFKLGGVCSWGAKIVIYFIYKSMYVLYLIISKLLYRVLNNLYKYYKLYISYIVFIIVCYILVIGGEVIILTFWLGIGNIIKVGGGVVWGTLIWVKILCVRVFFFYIYWAVREIGLNLLLISVMGLSVLSILVIRGGGA